ncbi:exodeoxyribonuclease VII large subunit [Deferribacterales bacterium RsTz2092]|nr:exodeoxyribonuclease 7 large subunit [Deferribacterales bacterium]
MQQFTISELTKLIKGALTQALPAKMMVLGEVAGISHSSSGHYYLSLKDAGALVKAVYFKYVIRQDSFIPKVGDKVRIIGKLTLYDAGGEYQVLVERIIYDDTGDFYRKFEETKRKLEALGYFDAATKRAIPQYPHKIALLTSPKGAAIGDFLKTAGDFLGTGTPKLPFNVDVWAIPVQGKDVAALVVQAIERAGRCTADYNVLVLTRGGGSLEDLSLFNDESIARALKHSQVPTISAIGHEQDWTICDMVADRRVATPTASAELLTGSYKTAFQFVDAYYGLISSKLNNMLTSWTLRLDNLTTRLTAAGPRHKLQLDMMRLKSLTGRLESAVNILLTACSGKLDVLTGRLNSLAPDRVLERGFAMVMCGERFITGADEVSIGDELTIRMRGGELSANITGKGA